MSNPSKIRSYSPVILLLIAFIATACSKGEQVHTEQEEDALSRTDFTDRIENFFEYEPLKPGRASQFLIHLTDMSDGSPVEKADVTLTVRAPSGAEVAQTKARVGKVTGIYVADVSIPAAGDYAIEFFVKNQKL